MQIQITQETKSVTTTSVSPIVLEPAQMDLIISSLSALGISANVPITSAMIGRVMVQQTPDGKFMVMIKIKE